MDDPGHASARCDPEGGRSKGSSRRREGRRGSIGEGVLESAAADDQHAAPLRSWVIEYVLIGLVTTGFGTCGLAQLFGAH